MSCGIVQSIIRQQRSQQADSLFTCSWPFHTQTFFFLFLICDLCGLDHTRRADGILVCEFTSSRAVEGHYVCKDWPKRETAEMSQIHSYRQWEREDAVRRRRRRRGLQRGCAGSDLEIRRWMHCFISDGFLLVVCSPEVITLRLKLIKLACQISSLFTE